MNDSNLINALDILVCGTKPVLLNTKYGIRNFVTSISLVMTVTIKPMYVMGGNRYADLISHDEVIEEPEVPPTAPLCSLIRRRKNGETMLLAGQNSSFSILSS